MTDFAKLDAALARVLWAHEAAGNAGNAFNRPGAANIADADEGEPAVSVGLAFEGDLAQIEALGFDTDSVTGNEAVGVVRFADIPALTDHPGVLFLSGGSRYRPALETSVFDINVRGLGAGDVGVGGDALYHAVEATGAMTRATDGTGQGVVVAIIDTGIDYTHPMFLSQLTPTKKTRIKRIWDQGLKPGSLADCPAAALLTRPNKTYGVEFDDTEIEAALNGGAALTHKDCLGHGTHVAGIAAGGPFFPSGGNARIVGVAPDADIIVVKMLDVPDEIRFRTAAGFGAKVDKGLFEDAVMYCVNAAKALGKPVVINMSFGSDGAPGDALDSDARWVDDVFGPTAKPQRPHVPKGAIVVKSAGNSGDTKRKQVAKITVPGSMQVPVPSSAQIVVPLRLRDVRGVVQRKYKTTKDDGGTCTRELFKPTIEVTFWYRRTVPHTAVKFALRLPDQAGFSGDMGVGGSLLRGFVPRTGPPKSVALVNWSEKVHSAFVFHQGPTAVPHPAGGTVRRHRVRFWVEPKQRGGSVSYHPGIYEMRITAPPGTEIFAVCDVVGWAAKKAVLFEIADKLQNGTARDGNVEVVAEQSASDTLGKHAITVGSYDDFLGGIADSSSRGPLRDYSDPMAPKALVADKPDIAAPGVEINSAQGRDTDVALNLKLPPWLAGRRFIQKDGTSMAAPMIAGVVACLLDKKADLSTTQVRGILAGAASPGVDPPPNTPEHTQAYGAGRVDARKSHDNTP